MLSPFDQAVKELIAVGQRLDARGLAPATGGNYSVRLKDGRVAVTVSGKHKGRLTPADIMLVDENAAPLEDKKPSDEAKLHAHIYKVYPEAQAALHMHSVAIMAFTRFLKADAVVLSNYELLKIFPGIKAHDITIRIPVVDNSQDMAEIIAAVDPALKSNPSLGAYIIRNHGFYTWGRDVLQAEYIAEALEHLIACELQLAKLNAGAKS